MSLFEVSRWSYLDPKVKKLWRIEAVIVGLIYAVIIAGAGFLIEQVVDEISTPIGIIGTILGVSVLALTIIVANKRYEFWRYLLGEHDISVSRGIWWKTWTFVPRARIQHVDITSGPIARALGLAVVSIYVGGHSGAVASIPGLAQAEAERIRQELLKQLAITVPPTLPGDGSA